MSNQVQSSKIQIQENVPLAQFTTFRIGGPARFFVIATDKDDLASAISWAKEKKMPVLILGGGSNLLIPDKGWSGLALRVAIGGWNFDNLPLPLIPGYKYLVKVGSGVYMIPLALEASRCGLRGLEWAGGLPGAVGGAVRGNAGAFRFEISGLIKSVEVWRPEGTIIMNRDECGFDYRASLFKTKLKNDIILSVELEMTAGDPTESREQLENFLSHRQKIHPTLASAGCVFKNVLFADDARILDRLTQITDVPEEFRKYKKIPAGWLVEKVGMKGARVGQAQVSPQHANFIVNLGDATALDVLTLIGQIKEKVYNSFQITLEEEMQIIQP